MKKMSIFKIVAVIFTAALLIGSCTKENEDVRLDPTLSTSQVTDVKSNSATVYGFVVAAGGGFSEKGVCFSNEPTPTTDNNKVIYEGDESLAAYPIKLTGLNFATKYYVRAYAINSTGTMYGEEFSFTTLPVLPTVTTTAVSAVTASEATTGGNVTADGGAEVTARGLCYADTANPTILGHKTEDGTGLGEFTSTLTELTELTKYYVRAYAINSAGVAYGEQVEFTTSEIIILARTWYVPGDYVLASYPGTTYVNWEPKDSPQLKSTDAEPDKVEGYVYMANGENQWKIATKPNWDGPNYGLESVGQLSETGANIVSPAGYYKINIDAATLAYTAIPTIWGVIGDATPGDWTDETPLMYDPALRTWTGGMHLFADKSFKFRANHDWGLNYGGTTDNLVFDGANILVTVESDYYFSLDLSNPLAYKFSANHWGLIGNATPGGWDSDQNMTWDDANRCMTITVDLIAGSMKFRANDAWDINLGGDINALTQGGTDIPVTEAGNYTIKLFLAGSGGHCTIVKN